MAVPGADEILARAQRLTARLEGIETVPHHGKPWLKVGGKTLAGPCREPGALAVHCRVELKEALIAARPDLYFDTDHFRGWPAVLVRMDAIDDETLAARLEAAWEARRAEKPRRR
jgi:hypothetical protein